MKEPKESKLAKEAHELVQKLFGTHAHTRSFQRVTVITVTPDQMEFSATANTKFEAKELIAQQIIDHYNHTKIDSKDLPRED